MITITGATGELGKRIVQQLLLQVDPAQLGILTRSPAKAAALAEKGVTVHQGDYDYPEALLQAFRGSDVLMFISNTDIGRRKEQHDRVVAAATEAKVGRIVYTSFVQYDPESRLAKSHADTESVIRASGLPHTFLRNNFYGEPYLVEIELAMKSGFYRTPTDSDAGVSFTTRDDIARAAAAVLVGDHHTGKVYELTGPENTTPTTFAEIAGELSGKTVLHQQTTWEELRADYVERGMAEEWLGLSVMLEQMIASGKLGRVSNDIELLTGKPGKSFREYAKEQLG